MRHPVFVLALLLCFGCDDGGGGEDLSLVIDAARPGADGGLYPDAAPPAADAGVVADAALADAAEPDAAPLVDAAPPEGIIPPAEPKAYSGGECPDFAAGRNTFTAGGAERSLDLYLPDNPTGAPLLFMWHPLGSNAGQVAAFLGAQSAARTRGYVIVVPESQRTQTEWGYVGNSAFDLALFDDLLTCLTAQYGLDRTRVYTTGFSAGALWSSYLVVHRADYLAAAVILSGGTNQFLPYRTPAYRLPVLLAWGGPTDQYGGVINFQDSTYDFRDHLRADGHTVVMCGHRGGHVPPVGVADWGYSFLELHATRDASSPLDTDGLGEAFPDICTLAE